MQSDGNGPLPSSHHADQTQRGQKMRLALALHGPDTPHANKEQVRALGCWEEGID